MTTDCASRCGKKPMLKCTTEKYSLCFTWEISDMEVSSLLNNGNIQSSIFSRGTDDEINWRLKLERNGEDGSMIDLKLCLVSSDEIELESVFKFDFRDPCYPIWKGKYKFTTLGQDLTIENIDFCKRYLHHDDVRGMTVSVHCGIDAVISSKPIISKFNWNENLEGIFKNDKFTDVTLCASGKEFRAHKVILAARSPVFNIMFDHEMDEKKQNRVDITDIDGDIFGELLRYIYTDKVENLNNFAIGLLSAADKYGLENLKVLCENELCTNISIENAAEVLVLADLHNVMKLRASAIKYICSNAEDVTKTAGWKLMTESHSNLVAEIVCYSAQHRAIKPSTD